MGARFTPFDDVFRLRDINSRWEQLRQEIITRCSEQDKLVAERSAIYDRLTQMMRERGLTMLRVDDDTVARLSANGKWLDLVKAARPVSLSYGAPPVPIDLSDLDDIEPSLAEAFSLPSHSQQEGNDVVANGPVS